jgi:hypothetical protein
MLGKLVKVTVGTGRGDPGAVTHGRAGTRVLMTTNAECTSGDDGPVATGTWRLGHRGCRDGAGSLPRMSGI